MDDDFDDVLQQCTNILASCNEVTDELSESDSDSAEAGLEFVDSVFTKVESIRSWGKKHGEFTERQRQSLNNMEEAVERWKR